MRRHFKNNCSKMSENFLEPKNLVNWWVFRFSKSEFFSLILVYLNHRYFLAFSDSGQFLTFLNVTSPFYISLRRIRLYLCVNKPKSHFFSENFKNDSNKIRTSGWLPLKQILRRRGSIWYFYDATVKILFICSIGT